MVDRPVGTAKAPSPSPPPTASLGYLDMIVPDLEDHLPPAPAIKAMPPVPESPMSSEEAEVVPDSTEEDSDEPVAVEHRRRRSAGDWCGGAAGCLVSRPPADRCRRRPGRSSATAEVPST